MDPKDRVCIRNLWKKCQEDVVDGGCKFGSHTKAAPEMLTHHTLYVNMLAEHGAPDTKAHGDKGKGKGGGKGKGKGKGKNKGGKPAAPALEAGEAAVFPQP